MIFFSSTVVHELFRDIFKLFTLIGMMSVHIKKYLQYTVMVLKKLLKGV